MQITPNLGAYHSATNCTRYDRVESRRAINRRVQLFRGEIHIHPPLFHPLFSSHPAFSRTFDFRFINEQDDSGRDREGRKAHVSTLSRRGLRVYRIFLPNVGRRTPL